MHSMAAYPAQRAINSLSITYSYAHSFKDAKQKTAISRDVANLYSF